MDFKRSALLLALWVSCAAAAFAQEEPPPVEAPVPAAPVQAVAQAEKPGRISLDIKGMDVVDVLKMLASRSSMNIVVGKNVAGRVTLFLKDVDIMDAFEIILSANELACDTKGSITNVMTQRDYELLYGQRYQDKKQARTVTLQYAKAADLSRALNQMKTAIGRIVVDEASNTLVLIDSPDKVTEMLEFVKSADMPLETRVFNLNYAQADKLLPKLQESATKGVGTVKIDERTNKVVVTDYPSRVNEIAGIIAAFDEKTPQVVIDAQIVEVSPNDQFAAGVDWDFWIKKNVRLASSLAAPSLTGIDAISNKLLFGVVAGDSAASPSEVSQYKSVIDLLRVIGETKIISSPRIMALNNQEAKILVGTKEAYITSSTALSTTGTVTSQAVNFVDVGIKLYVTPTINSQGFVTMKIRPEVSSSVPVTLTAEDKKTQVPIVTTSETETTIMVKDGSTIIIAGLKRDRQAHEVRKVPVAGDLPLVGAAFRNSKKENLKTELVIFITPHIVTGEETVEYKSLTNDRDIRKVQEVSTRHSQASSLSPQEYKKYVVNTIKASLLKYRNEQGALTGRAVVTFTLNSTGYLAEDPVVVSSDNPRLSSLALFCVKGAAPFPAFPPSLKKKQEFFKISLAYR